MCVCVARNICLSISISLLCFFVCVFTLVVFFIVLTSHISLISFIEYFLFYLGVEVLFGCRLMILFCFLFKLLLIIWLFSETIIHEIILKIVLRLWPVFIRNIDLNRNQNHGIIDSILSIDLARLIYFEEQQRQVLKLFA